MRPLLRLAVPPLSPAQKNKCQVAVLASISLCADLSCEKSVPAFFVALTLCCNLEVAAMAAYAGECFCGAVKLEVSGEPEGMGYCHCRSCRSWSGGPVNAFTLWKPGAVRVTAGAEHLGLYQKTPVSERQYCKKCGGHLMTNHPPLGLVDVFAATLPALEFSPGVHVNYAETVLPMRDGLPKFKDFPAEFGGSGETIAE